MFFADVQTKTKKSITTYKITLPVQLHSTSIVATAGTTATETTGEVQDVLLVGSHQQICFMARLHLDRFAVFLLNPMRLLTHDL